MTRIPRIWRATEYSYYFDDSLAGRRDARGVQFIHRYDDQGRWIET
ncbi:MAG: hypothetical protein AAFX79_01515 [Planctomycetota bacterium]